MIDRESLLHCREKLLKDIVERKNIMLDNNLKPSHIIINNEDYNTIKDCDEIKDLKVIKVERKDIVII